jgi:hypothetical protein
VGKRRYQTFHSGSWKSWRGMGREERINTEATVDKINSNWSARNSERQGITKQLSLLCLYIPLLNTSFRDRHLVIISGCPIICCNLSIEHKFINTYVYIIMKCFFSLRNIHLSLKVVVSGILCSPDLQR